MTASQATANAISKDAAAEVVLSELDGFFTLTEEKIVFALLLTGFNKSLATPRGV